jgi:predicted alpha/beta hydrolase family esterase
LGREWTERACSSRSLNPFGLSKWIGPTGFAPCPLIPLPFKSIVVASTDDPFAGLERPKAFAAVWGSELVILESAGHINAASGYGPWPNGEKLVP